MQQSQPQKLPEKKSNLWLIIIVIIILLALLWPVFRKSKAPADLSDLNDDTASSTDDRIDLSDLSDGVKVVPPTPIPSVTPIASATTMPLKVFFGFGKQERKPETAQCGLTFFTTRVVPTTSAVARAALTELLKGPTAKELSLDFFTLVNSKATIKELTINNGVARVNFSDNLMADPTEIEAEDACLKDGIRGQITSTLKQFSTVKSVEILVNGVEF